MQRLEKITGFVNKVYYMTLVSFPISYGDRIPKSPCGRLVCFTWIIMGLIMVTCFNSTMTSLLTARILDKEVNLYGTKVC